MTEAVLPHQDFPKSKPADAEKIRDIYGEYSKALGGTPEGSAIETRINEHIGPELRTVSNAEIRELLAECRELAELLNLPVKKKIPSGTITIRSPSRWRDNGDAPSGNISPAFLQINGDETPWENIPVQHTGESGNTTQNRENLNDPVIKSINDEEKNMLIAVVFAESSPHTFYTEKEMAGIAFVVLNRARERHGGQTTVKGVLTAKSQVKTVEGKLYRYAMYELDKKNPDPVDVTKKWNNTDREWNAKKLEDAKNAVSKVLSGQIADPATRLGNGKGAIYWGSRDDYNSGVEPFRSAKAGKMGEILWVGGDGKIWGTCFFRGP